MCDTGVYSCAHMQKTDRMVGIHSITLCTVPLSLSLPLIPRMSWQSASFSNPSVSMGATDMKSWSHTSQ